MVNNEQTRRYQRSSRRETELSRRLFTDCTEREVSVFPKDNCKNRRDKERAQHLTYTSLFYSGMNGRNTPGPPLAAKQVTATILFIISSWQFVSWINKQLSERKVPSQVQETESSSMAFFSRILLQNPSQHPQEQSASQSWNNSCTPKKT